MWVYFYISEKRVAQLAYQIDPKLPAELISKWDVKGGVKGNIEAKTSKLIEIIGAKGSASASGDAAFNRLSESRITIPPEAVIDTVCNFLTKKENYSNIGPTTTQKDLYNIKTLVRFNGRFKPQIEGENVAEKLSNYAETTSVQWKGDCGDVQVIFPTTKASLVSDTPIIQCLLNDPGSLFIDGFGTVNTNDENRMIQLLPLFFGLEIDE